MEVNDDDHFAVAALEEAVSDVRVEYVDLLSPDAGEAEAVDVRLELARHSLLLYVRSYEDLLQLRVRAADTQDELLLLHDAFHLLLLLLTVLEPVLHVLYQSQGCVQVG